MGSAKRGGRAAPRPGGGVLVAAAVLAGLGGAWAGFQWRQLVVARSGGDPFCALGAGDACAQLGDSAFARAIEGATGLPVAGWGAVWSVAALVLPLLALRRGGAGRSPEPFWSATALAAVAGTASVVLLAGVSLQAGVLCTNCAITYLLVLAYAAVVLGRARTAPTLRLAAGTLAVGGAVVGAFVVLLPAGLRTPRGIDAATAKLLHALHGSAPSAAARGGVPDRAELTRRIESLSMKHRQYLSDARGMYLASNQRVELRAPRALHGSPMAPIRITHFSDLLCSHCARFHEELEQLLAAVPPNSFSIESRNFPLDRSCNPYASPRADQPLRCLAARALICLEGHPEAFALEGRIFERHDELTEQLLFQLIEPYVSRAALERCAASPETQAKLGDDIAWAAEHAIEGTPLVLVNGRKTLTSLPFLYVMAVTGGDTDHAAFQGLPSPQIDVSGRSRAGGN